MKNQNRLLLMIAIAALLVLVSCNQIATSAPVTQVPTLTVAATIQPNIEIHSLNVDGLERSYLMHVPAGLDRLTPTPVVFIFHGYSMTAQSMLSIGFNDMADKDGFLAVYPVGIDLSFNAGDCCGSAADSNIDDISFVRKILEDLKTIATIDTKRIYATGFSNGAMFSYRLACEMSDTFAAIAPVSGLLMYSPCLPQQPVSVIHEHGLSDMEVPYSGGRGDMYFPTSVQQSIATWAKLDGCIGTPQVSKQGITEHSVYDSCRDGSTVELYTNDEQVHDWPSVLSMPYAKIIWEFFASHPKP